MLLRLAWRNLWRNKRRTLLTMTALALGVCAIVFMSSYRERIFEQMIEQLTAGQMGHIQVHGNGWQSDPEISNVVADPVAIEARLADALPGARAAQRVVGYGLVGAAEQSAAVIVVGLDPGREPSGNGPLTVEKGRGLSAEPRKEAIVGRALADQLQVNPGPDAEIVMLGQAADGSTANDRFTVVGVADAGSAELDATAVFLHLADAQEFFGLGSGVHQVVVRLPPESEDLAEHVDALRGALDLAELEALSWDEMLPELKTMIEQKKQSQQGIFSVVFLIVGLGVFNAMSMSTFERTREFGVMASLGTRRGRILRLVVTEALLQGFIGFVVGVLLAFALTLAIGSVEMGALASGDVMGVRMPSRVAVGLDVQSIVSAAVTVLFTMFAGGLWPAWRASRLEPVRATRYV